MYKVHWSRSPLHCPAALLLKLHSWLTVNSLAQPTKLILEAVEDERGAGGIQSMEAILSTVNMV